jgi:hypothetical protein
MREKSIAGWAGCGRVRAARRVAAGRCCGGVWWLAGGCPGPPRARPNAQPGLSQQPSSELVAGGGRGAQAHSRVLPMKDAGFALARLSPGSHQATATTTWSSPGMAAPEAIAGSHGTRRVTTTCSWRSSAAASAAWACPVLSRLTSRVVRWVSRAA